ncbi:MAG: hypothetical protein J6T55_03090 [Alphaproteobacteria bacterium]|nr:hypothetical protein [Alphaproteobacteria bacterium]
MIKNETGRSMIEMLGVLVIMGILTVTGVAGYIVALNRLRANEISGTIALFSIYAQGHHVDVENLNGFKDEIKDIPECIEAASATKMGRVNVTFKDTKGCKEMMQMVSNNYGTAHWKKTNAVKATYLPYGDSE